MSQLLKATFLKAEIVKTKVSTANNVICHKVVGEGWNADKEHILDGKWAAASMDKCGWKYYLKRFNISWITVEL